MMEQQLGQALEGSDIVIILAGVPHRPGWDDLFNIKAEIVKSLFMAIAKYCTNALLNIISNPVHLTVPIVVEVFKKAGTYDEKNLFGVTMLDVVRAKTFYAAKVDVSVSDVDDPIVGGHAGVTILLFSRQLWHPLPPIEDGEGAVAPVGGCRWEDWAESYTDPEYETTRGLTEKSDVYSFGVLLLELVSGRPATFDDTSLVEWSQELIASNSKLRELVDPAILDSFNLEQLQAVVMVIQWCTQREGRLRPSMKQVLRVLLERFDPLHSRFTQAIQDEKRNQGGEGKQNESELIQYHNDDRSLQFSSRSYCSGSGLVETDSPTSPSSILSV